MMIVKIDGEEFTVAGDSGEFTIDQDLAYERECAEALAEVPADWNRATEAELDAWAEEQIRLTEDVG